MSETRLTRDRLEALLKQMADAKIVVVGDAMLDVYLVGEVDRVSPEAPVPVVTVHASRHGLGGAANVAANVAALGADCRLVAVVGEDQRGQSVKAEPDDPKFKNFFAYRGATVFKPNRRELELAMGAALDLAHPDALPDALGKLAVDNLLLTLGGEGMMLVTKDQEITRIPTMAREVFDVSGAGDTVTAWVGTALAAGASVREGAGVANCADGIRVGKAGGAPGGGHDVHAAR